MKQTKSKGTNKKYKKDTHRHTHTHTLHQYSIKIHINTIHSLGPMPYALLKKNLDEVSTFASVNES